MTIPGSLTTGSVTTGGLTTGSLTIGTRPINDYVIEEHIATTDTDWSWRKWNSGIAECWKRFYSGSFAPNFTLGGGFYARVLGPFDLPSGLFTTIPFGNFDFTYWGNTYFWGSLRSITATDYSLTVFKYGNESTRFISNFYSDIQSAENECFMKYIIYMHQKILIDNNLQLLF